MKKVTSPYVVIKKSRIHSKGAYAKKDIPADTRVIEYVGRKVTKAQSDKISNDQYERADKNKDHGAVYLFELNKRHDIDGNVSYNTAKFLNHSCLPNCETDIIRGKIWITSLRDIKKGEELTYNYGYGYADYADHQCRCRSANCIGYILDEKHWWRLRKKKAAKQPKRK